MKSILSLISRLESLCLAAEEAYKARCGLYAASAEVQDEADAAFDASMVVVKSAETALLSAVIGRELAAYAAAVAAAPPCEPGCGSLDAEGIAMECVSRRPPFMPCRKCDAAIISVMEAMKKARKSLFSPAEIEALVAAAQAAPEYQGVVGSTVARTALRHAIEAIRHGRISSSPWFVTSHDNVKTLSKGRVYVARVTESRRGRDNYIDVLDPEIEARHAAERLVEAHEREARYASNLAEARRLLAAGEVLPHFEGQEGGTVMLPGGTHVSANGALKPFGMTEYKCPAPGIIRAASDYEARDYRGYSGFVCLDWAAYDAQIETQQAADRAANVARSAREMQLLGY